MDWALLNLYLITVRKEEMMNTQIMLGHAIPVDLKPEYKCSGNCSIQLKAQKEKRAYQ